MSVLEKTLETTPSFAVLKPGCPFCVNAVKTLNNNKVQYTKYDFEEDKELADDIKAATGHATFPMIYINKKFIGGFQQLKEHFNTKK